MADVYEAALDINEAAKMIGVTPSALRRWKLQHEGPPYFLAGRCVRYEPAALREWIQERTVRPARTKVS